jgi:thiamine biosynthesis protein ThiS
MAKTGCFACLFPLEKTSGGEPAIPALSPTAGVIASIQSMEALKKDESVRGTIHIIVNGMMEEVPEGATLAFLIEHFQARDPALIVEHNGRFVFPKQYGTTTVSPNDRVEFINPDFGG